MQRWAYLLVTAGAVLWGIIGIFVQGLYNFGFTPGQVVTIRVTGAGLFLLVYTTAVHRPSLKINPRDIKYFIGTGILSIVFLTALYHRTYLYRIQPRIYYRDN